MGTHDTHNTITRYLLFNVQAEQQLFASLSLACIGNATGANRVCLPRTIIGPMPANYNNHTHAWPKAGLGGYLIQAVHVCSHFGSLRPSSGKNMACPLLGRACVWVTHLGSEVLSELRSNAACECSYSSSKMCCIQAVDL